MHHMFFIHHSIDGYLSCCHVLSLMSPALVQFNSVQFSNWTAPLQLSAPHGTQHTRPPCPSPAPRVYPTHVHQVGDAIQPSHPLSSSSSPALNLSQHQGLFQWDSSLHQVTLSIGASALASVLPMNILGWFPLGWTGWDLVTVQGTQESSPKPQFKSINSSALSFLYSPTLTSIHNY